MKNTNNPTQGFVLPLKQKQKTLERLSFILFFRNNCYRPDIFWCWSQSAQKAGVLPEATSSLPEPWWEQLCSSWSTLPKTTVGSIARLQSAVVLAALITCCYRVVILVFQNPLRYKSIIDLLCD